VSGKAETERLLALSVPGELLPQRQGAAWSVRVDPELDGRLGRPGRQVVLVHNHPASAGLSAADLTLLARPGLAAIVAIGHDGSVYVASAGPRFDREFFDERQHAVANGEVQKRLRYESPTVLSAAVGSAHLSHLVTLVLADAGVVHYWFELRGAGRLSYERARFPFTSVVVAASKPLKAHLK